MSAADFQVQKKEFLEFLKLLNDNDLLDKVIVAGSWAEFVYAQSGLLKDFDGSLRTLDVDFLVKNMRLPSTPTSLISLAKNAGYDVMHDIMYETTKIITPTRLEIEFLINQLGSGEHPVLKTNLGVNAQALRHMDIALRNAVTVQLLGMPVTVPKPEAYVLHKMVINSERKPDKQVKDAKAVYHLAPFLDKEVYQDVYDGLSKKEKKRVDDFILKNGKLFEEEETLEEKLAHADLIAQKYSKNKGFSSKEIEL